MSLWDTFKSAREFAENAVDALAADDSEEEEEEEAERNKPEMLQEKSSSSSKGFLSNATNVFNQVADIILPEEEEEEMEKEEGKDQSNEAELFRIQARQLADELRKSMERNRELEARIEALNNNTEASNNTESLHEITEEFSKLRHKTEESRKISSNTISELKTQNEILQKQLQLDGPKLKSLEIELEKKTIEQEKLKTLEIELERSRAALQSRRRETNVEEQRQSEESKHHQMSISELKSLNLHLREQLQSKDPEIERLEIELQKSFERSRDEIEAERRASLDTHHREQAKMDMRMKKLLKKYHDLEQEHEINILSSREAMSKMEHKFETYESLQQTQHEESLRNFQRDLKQAQELADTNESDTTRELISRLNTSNEQTSQVKVEFENYKTRAAREIQHLEKEASVRIEEISERNSKLRDEYESVQKSQERIERETIEIQAQQIRDENEELRNSLERDFLKRLETSKVKIKELTEETMQNATLESEFQKRLERLRQVSGKLRDENETLRRDLSQEYQSKLERSTKQFETQMKLMKDQADAKAATLRRELILARADLKMTIQFLNDGNVPSHSSLNDENFAKEENENVVSATSRPIQQEDISNVSD